MQEFEDLNFLDNCDIDGGLRKKNIFKKSNLAKPLISIITPVLNNEKYFEECLESIYSQKYDNFEHIVIDGASKDGTLSILKKV